MILKTALNYSDVSVTQTYLEADEDDVMVAIAKCDFTRKAGKSTIQCRVKVPPDVIS